MPGAPRAASYTKRWDTAFGYTWFCTHFEAWTGRVRPSMRQTHVGGEKVFIDFAGDTVDIVDPATGEVSEAKLFVAAIAIRLFNEVWSNTKVVGL